MSFDINSIKNAKSDRPPRIFVYGCRKIGKSSFASQAPSPVFIQTEDGLDHIDTPAFPLAAKYMDIMDAIRTLFQGEHKYKTVVLDTADWTERLLQKQVARDHNVKGIEDIGYGKGYVYVAEYFREILDGLNALRNERNMIVIILAHAEIKRFDDPMSDSYDRYQIKMNKSNSQMAQEWSDIIGFAQEEMIIKTEEKKGFKKEKRNRAVTTNSRVLRLSGSVSFDAGNRYGLPSTIPLAWSELEAALNAARTPVEAPKKKKSNKKED